MSALDDVIRQLHSLRERVKADNHTPHTSPRSLDGSAKTQSTGSHVDDSPSEASPGQAVLGDKSSPEAVRSTVTADIKAPGVDVKPAPSAFSGVETPTSMPNNLQMLKQQVLMHQQQRLAMALLQQQAGMNPLLMQANNGTYLCPCILYLTRGVL